MKKITMLIAIVVFSMVIVSSCNKEDDLKVSENANKTMTNARLNTELSNEEMEKDILNFMDKLEDPASYEGLNYEEAFDYIEATLNFKYINYDYSKCANTESFNGSAQFTLADGDIMEMDIVKEVYDAILEDWREKYYSVGDEIKTPIVFDITEITTTNVKYEMTVGYGSLDLSLWGEEFVPAASTYFIDAANQYTYQLYAHLHNIQLQLVCYTNGSRIYIPNVGQEWIPDPRLHPSTPDPVLPIDNGITDYEFFYTNSDIVNYNGYHLYLNDLEYKYYKDQLCNYMQNFVNTTIGTNYVNYASVNAGGNYPTYNYVAMHQFKFYYGHTYCTSITACTL